MPVPATSQVVKQLKDVHKEWCSAIHHRNIERIGALLTDDCIFQSNWSGSVIGCSGVMNLYKTVFAAYPPNAQTSINIQSEGTFHDESADPNQPNLIIDHGTVTSEMKVDDAITVLPQTYTLVLVYQNNRYKMKMVCTSFSTIAVPQTFNQVLTSMATAQ